MYILGGQNSFIGATDNDKYMQTISEFKMVNGQNQSIAFDSIWTRISGLLGLLCFMIHQNCKMYAFLYELPSRLTHETFIVRFK